ncbi:MAG: Ig-like domain-containing protein [Verrucomicrobiota bacterium]
MIKSRLLFKVVVGLFVSSAHLTALQAQSVSLAWNASSSPGVAGYVVRYGTASGVYSVATNVGNQTSATVSGLQAGQTYYLAVTARDSAGVESLPSNEASYQVPVVLPQISLDAPLANANYQAPASINCAASVIANGHTITKVQFYNGSTLLGEDATAPYSLNWSSVAAGTYNVSAQVVYDSGSTVATAAANVTVTNPLPVIALAAPTSGASYVAPASINCAANVTANGHTITKVQFYNGSALLGEATTAPYSFAWSGVTAGSYSVSARLVYDSGSTLASTAASISVTNPLPAIVLTSPTNNSSYGSPATVAIAASVTPNGRTITKVQFFNGSALLGEDTSAPYGFTWTNVSAGTYALLARAVYDSSSTVDSTTANISVNGLPAPWQTSDLGAVGLTGSASGAGGIYSVRGAGKIAGTADSFRFVYQTLSADGEIKAQLTALPTSSTNGSFGVMIRETLTAGSRYAYMGLSQDLKFRWQRRTSTSGNTSTTTATVAAVPNTWVRLVRSGSTITGYKSADGVTWTKVNSRSISMAANVYVGFVVASGSTSVLGDATFASSVVVP